MRLRDSYTQEITLGLRTAIFELTGCYPYVILNLLHRKKFDANRSIETAADENLAVENSWSAYHDFINEAKTSIENNYTRGLFIDIHGHAHDIQRIEVGYLLSKSELMLTDEELNTELLINETSIKQLVTDNVTGLGCSELIRGNLSLGTLLHEQGFPSVPSLEIPSPLGTEPYFQGGYNVVQHGSKHGGPIDAIQLEFNQDLRFDSTERSLLIDSLTATLIHYIDVHYHPTFATNFCLLPELGIESNNLNEISVYPNPTLNTIWLSTAERGTVTLYNASSIAVFKENWNSNAISLNTIESGVYLLVLENERGERYFSKIIKR